MKLPKSLRTRPRLAPSASSASSGPHSPCCIVCQSPISSTSPSLSSAARVGDTGAVAPAEHGAACTASATAEEEEEERPEEEARARLGWGIVTVHEEQETFVPVTASPFPHAQAQTLAGGAAIETETDRAEGSSSLRSRSSSSLPSWSSSHSSSSSSSSSSPGSLCLLCASLTPFPVFGVVATFTTQGVNEMQTVANKLGQAGTCIASRSGVREETFVYIYKRGRLIQATQCGCFRVCLCASFLCIHT